MEIQYDYYEFIEIYQEILDGQRMKFPRGTWNREDSTEIAKFIIKWLIEEHLDTTFEKVIPDLNEDFIAKYKLRSAYNHLFNYSINSMLENLFPEYLHLRVKKYTATNRKRTASDLEVSLNQLRECYKENDNNISQTIYKKSGRKPSKMFFEIHFGTWNKALIAAGIIKHDRKLTREDVKQIRKQHEEGIDKKVIAENFGINPHYVYQIITQRHWKNI